MKVKFFFVILFFIPLYHAVAQNTDINSKTVEEWKQQFRGWLNNESHDDYVFGVLQDNQKLTGDKNFDCKVDTLIAEAVRISDGALSENLGMFLLEILKYRKGLVDILESTGVLPKAADLLYWELKVNLDNPSTIDIEQALLNYCQSAEPVLNEDELKTLYRALYTSFEKNDKFSDTPAGNFARRMSEALHSKDIDRLEEMFRRIHILPYGSPEREEIGYISLDGFDEMPAEVYGIINWDITEWDEIELETSRLTGDRDRDGRRSIFLAKMIASKDGANAEGRCEQVLDILHTRPNFIRDIADDSSFGKICDLILQAMDIYYRSDYEQNYNELRDIFAIYMQDYLTDDEIAIMTKNMDERYLIHHPSAMILPIKSEGEYAALPSEAYLTLHHIIENEMIYLPTEYWVETLKNTGALDKLSHQEAAELMHYAIDNVSDATWAFLAYPEIFCATEGDELTPFEYVMVSLLSEDSPLNKKIAENKESYHGFDFPLYILLSQGNKITNEQLSKSLEKIKKNVNLTNELEVIIDDAIKQLEQCDWILQKNND